MANGEKGALSITVVQEVAGIQVSAKFYIFIFRAYFITFQLAYVQRSYKKLERLLPLRVETLKHNRRNTKAVLSQQ